MSTTNAHGAPAYARAVAEAEDGDWRGPGCKLPVTVVVPTVARPDWLRRCLNAVLAQEPPAERILVVGRTEDSATVDVVRDFSSRVDWASVSISGHVDPVRVAIRECKSEFIAFIDDDAEPLHTDWLANLLSVLRDGKVGLVGSRVVDSTPRPQRVRRSAGRVTWFGRPIGNAGSRTDAYPVDVDMVPEGNSMWRFCALREIGIDAAWDEGDAALYGLDLALCAKRDGWRVVFTSAAPILHHLAPRLDETGSRSDPLHRTRVFARSITYIAMKHYRLRLVPFAVWSTLIGDSSLVGGASAIFLRVRRGQRGLVVASWRGRADGLRAWRHRCELD